MLGKAARLSLTSLFAALTAACAQLQFKLGPVPYTMQNFAVMLAGLTLRPRYAALSQLMYLLLVAAGAPAAAGLRGGPAALTGHTAGYLWMFPVSSLLMSCLSRAYAAKRPGALLNPTLRDRAALLLLSLAAALPMYAAGFLVLCYHALQPTALGEGLSAWSGAVAAALGLRGLGRLQALFVASVLIFIPQDLLVDHLLAVLVASRVLRYMSEAGLEVP